MPANFTAPTILFFGAAGQPERALYYHYYTALRGKYPRLVEPAAGAFASPLVWVDAGGSPEDVEASDVNLYSSVVGLLLSGGDLSSLSVRVDGRKIRLPASPVKAAARILWRQLLTRFEVRADRQYWAEMVEDVTVRQDEHEAAIVDKLTGFQERLGGLSYKPADLRDHVLERLDDPEAFIHLDPPTYTGGYEKFYDTKGRLTWDEPEYQIYDPDTGAREILEAAAGRPALLTLLEARPPGEASGPDPVYARHSAAGAYWYLHSNRPDELLATTDGPIIKPRDLPEAVPLPISTMPRDYEITRRSTVDIIPVATGEAQYYRDLWMHRISTGAIKSNFVVTIDGLVAGVASYNVDSIARLYPNAKGPAALLIRFAPGAPHHTYRIGRLVTKIAMQERTIVAILNPTELLWAATVEEVTSTNYTQYPEAKSMRGLMKLASKTTDKDGYRLAYRAPIEDQTYAEVLDWWLQKETNWRAARNRKS